jgi:hypothetical protein
MAVEELGLSFPSTIGELAEVLARVGVYDRSISVDGVNQWRCEEELPPVVDVLPVPEDWAEREQEVRRLRVIPAASSLLRHFSAQGRPQEIKTSLGRLSQHCEVSESAVRRALEWLIDERALAVRRFTKTLSANDLKQVVEHLRIVITLDWNLINDQWGNLDEEEGDLSDLRWNGSPWMCYREASQQGVGSEALKVMGFLPFRFTTPDEAGSIISLAELAVGQNLSVVGVVDALIELEKAGYATWDNKSQLLRLAIPMANSEK